MQVNQKTPPDWEGLMLRIQETFDTALRRFLEFFGADFDFGQLLVGRKKFVELQAVLLHNVLDVVVVEAQVLGFVVVRIYQSDEFVVSLYDNTF